MRVHMHKLGGGDTQVLAGATKGRRARAELLERTGSEPSEPEKIFLDFQNVEVATASYLRESVLSFRDEIRRRRSNYYPVIANPRELVVEELRILVTTRGDALMLCSLDQDNHIKRPYLLGELDPKQRFTFDLVRRLGETSAAELMLGYGESEKTTVQTAWNNRLSSLANLGLVVELSQGRSKRYRSLFAE